MQQEHRIILTTLSCSFGSWAPAQVTAPCGADNPRAGSHLTRRPGRPSSSPSARPGGHRPLPPSVPNAHHVRPESTRPVLVQGVSCLADAGDGPPHRRTQPRSQPPGQGRGRHAFPVGGRLSARRERGRPGTTTMSWQVTTALRGAVVVARVRPGQVKVVAPRDPGRPNPLPAGQRNEFHRCDAARRERDVSKSRFGAVFPSEPNGSAPGHARNQTLPCGTTPRTSVPRSRRLTSRPPSSGPHARARRHVRAW
jgi:hypothetical protein